MPIAPKAGWFSIAITDAALFHATLWHSALHYGIVHGKGNNNVDALYHRGKALSIIGERVGKEESCSDGTIGTVLCMLLLANLNGSLKAAETHIMGLRQLVEKRGGLWNLGFDGSLQRMTLWNDIAFATATHSEPYYPLSDTPTVLLPSDGMSLSSPTDSLSSPLTPETLPPFDTDAELLTLVRLRPGCSIDLQRCFYDIHYVSAFLNRAKRTEVGKENQMAFSDRVYIIERRLLTLLNEAYGKTDTENEVLDWLYKAILEAALIHIYSTVRGVPVSCGVYAKKVERILNALASIDLLFVSETFPALLVWVLFVGGAAARGRPERGSFVAAVGSVSKGLKLEEWDDIKGVLGRVIVLEKTSRVPFYEVWGEVVGARPGIFLIS
jgi:Fungal specific transcription factor domain